MRRGVIGASSTTKIPARECIIMMICNVKSIAAVLIGMAMASAPALSAEWATKEEAQAMVKKAVSFIKSEGTENAYKGFTAKDGRFTDRDLYVVVYQLNGKVLAHGANAKLVGKEMIDAQDVDGKYYVKERTELAQKQGTFWQDYKFVNPVSKKVEPKQMYCERVEQTAVCAGVYKQ
jgi:cytochrome c